MNLVVGIDEVGRGPLAGPVTVCAVACGIFEYKKMKLLKSLPVLGKDSKKLTKNLRRKYREVLEIYSSEKNLSYSIVHVSNKVIDKKGISYAINFAIKKAIDSLSLPENTLILLDGGLKAPQNFINQKTIIKGDEKEKIISWASIIAKVERDGLMEKMGKKYPVYKFDLHKGYGTKKHRIAIKKHGLTPIHRKTWIH